MLDLISNTQISITSFSMKLNLGGLVLRPVLNYSHKSLVPMVTVIQALYCIILIYIHATLSTCCFCTYRYVFEMKMYKRL